MNHSICIVYCGGTFGCTGAPLKPLSAPEFFKHFKKALVSLHVPSQRIDFLAGVVKDSSQLTLSNFAAIFRTILARHQAGTDHFIIITGTDTLSYLVNFLHFGFFGLPVSITLVASMQPFFDQSINGKDGLKNSLTVNQGSDAADNMALAIQRHKATHLYDGVKSAVSRRLIPAYDVQKLHSRHDDAFINPFFENAISSTDFDASDFNISDFTISASAALQLSQLLQDWLTGQSDNSCLDKLSERISSVRIVSYYCLPTAMQHVVDQLASLIAQKPDAIILLGFGTGNFPHCTAIQTKLRDAQAAGILVVASTQVPFGGVSAGYSAGSWLAQSGALSAHDLNTPCLYALLVWLCALELHRKTRKALLHAMLEPSVN